MSIVDKETFCVIITVMDTQKSLTVQKRVYAVDAARLSYIARVLNMSSQDILAPWIRKLYMMVGLNPDNASVEKAKECIDNHIDCYKDSLA